MLMKGNKPIVVVGSVNFDLVARVRRVPAAGETVSGTEFRMYPGGKGANQAVAIARLGYPVKIIAKVGTDDFGERLRTNLAANGVGIEGVGQADGASGVAVIVVGHRGENSIIIAPGANGQMSRAYVEEHSELIRQAGMVLTQLEIPMPAVEHVARLCQRFDVPLMLDPAPARQLSPALMRRVRWLTPNEVEAGFYAPAGHRTPSPERIARFLLARGIAGVVLKRGAEGALVAQGDRTDRVRAIRVKVADTTAAGDAFNGAFAVGIQRGLSPHDSARFAVTVAALSVSKPGAQPSMPSISEVRALLRRTSLGSALPHDLLQRMGRAPRHLFEATTKQPDPRSGNGIRSRKVL